MLAFGLFLSWVRYYGTIHGIPVVAVSPHYTSQDCSGCGCRVKKSLSVRTHVYPSCGLLLKRDLNAALTILFCRIPSLGAPGNGQGLGLGASLGGSCAEAFASPDTTGSAPGWNQESPW